MKSIVAIKPTEVVFLVESILLIELLRKLLCQNSSIVCWICSVRLAFYQGLLCVAACIHCLMVCELACSITAFGSLIALQDSFVALVTDVRNDWSRKLVPDWGRTRLQSVDHQEA